jgi:hypothetical protein
MGNLKACFVVATLALAACGSDHAAPDAAIVLIDSPPVDMAPPVDSPPDVPAYDFSCLGQPDPTTATDPITVAGTTETLSQSGLQTLPGVTVEVFKTGTANAVDTQTSAADGSFTSGDIATGGVPFDGYVKGTLDGYRTSYLYPPSPPAASVTGVPLALFTDQILGQLAQFAQVTQDDTTNGLLFLTVTDCSNTPIQGATLSIQQGGQDVGTQFDLGALVSQAAGINVVFNVPDGATDITGSYGGMTFPMHTVVAHKMPNGQGAVGTVTLTTVRPGP